MDKSFLRLVFLTMLIVSALGFFVYAANDLQCTILAGSSCDDARLIVVENDTGGFENAHAQNLSYTTYAYSVCCNNSNASINITDGCPGNATVLQLSDVTNAHVEIGSNSNYSVSVCLSSDWKHVECGYVSGSCAPPYICVVSMANSEGPNTTNAHVGNCSNYDQKVCCKLENKAPAPPPTLYYPANGNTSVFERRPNFNWSATTDPDGDSVDYSLNLTCGSCPVSCPNVDISGISTTNYTLTSALCVDQSYNWTVSACDPYDACNTSLIWNFTILSTAAIEFIINATGFGDMTNNENNDTTDESPTPLVARNIGNVLVNVTVNATTFFESVDMDTLYYQFKSEENESGSYNQSCSQHTAFTNMDTSPKTLFCNLTYEVGNDEGELEINITVPPAEGAGFKSSFIEVATIQTE